MIEPTEPVRLQPAQQAHATEALARSFHRDPIYVLVFPDTRERHRALRSLFDAVVSYTLRYGQVDTTPEAVGAACWLTPGNTDVTLWRMFRSGFKFQRAVASFRPEDRRRLLAILAFADEFHKRLMTGPHWYLWALGVDPAHQGRGIGGKLLQPGLAAAGEQRLPCYLETQTEENVAFYARWDFKAVSDEVMPGEDLRVWSMVREPGSQSRPSSPLAPQHPQKRHIPALFHLDLNVCLQER